MGQYINCKQLYFLLQFVKVVLAKMRHSISRLYHFLIILSYSESKILAATNPKVLTVLKSSFHPKQAHIESTGSSKFTSTNFLPLDWFEFIIPLKLLQWQYFTVITGRGNYTEDSGKNWAWNWSLKIWDKFFVVMKEHYGVADIEKAEMFKLFPSLKTRRSSNVSLLLPHLKMNPHDDDELYSSNHQQLHFVCFVEPSEFLLISKLPNFLRQSWLLLSTSNEIDILNSWNDIFRQLNLYLDMDIYLGIFNSSILAFNVYDVYRISSSSHSVHISFFCTVKSNNEFEGDLCTADKYQRRQNLQGMSIKAVAVNVNPFEVNVSKSEDFSTKKSWTINGGLYKEIFSIIANELNIHYNVTILEGYKFGKFNSINQSWDGILGMVSRNEVDLSMSPLSMAADRLNFVDFSVATQSVGVRIYIRRIVAEKSINWKFYSSPFSPFLHLAVVTLSLSLAVVLQIVLTTGHPQDEDSEFTLKESSWVILSAVCQKGSHMIPSRASGKMIFLIAYFSFLIIYCGYSATLTSQLSVPPPLKVPFQNLLGLTHVGHGWTGGPIRGDFTYIVMQKTCRDILAKSTNTSRSQQCELLTRAWNQVVEPIDSSLPKSFLEGLRKVLTDKFAFIATMTGARYTISSQMTDREACSIYEIQEEPLSSHLAFVFRKNLTFKKLFNFKLVRLYQSGSLSRIKTRWLPKLKTCTRSEERTEGTDATLYDVATAPLLFLMGILLSCLVLAIECLILTCQNPRETLPSVESAMRRRRTIGYIYNSTLLQPN